MNWNHSGKLKSIKLLMGTTIIIPILRLDYTGHEHHDAFGLINMNARMYDPLLGRMCAPDNLLHPQYGTQGFNRYSYALNNPLKYIDPDGNMLLEFLVGYVHGFFNKSGSASERFSNAWMTGAQKIDAAGRIRVGQFTGSAAQIFSRHSWETFQNGIGLGYAIYMNITHDDVQAVYFDGATVISGPKVLGGGAAVTIGSYITGNSKDIKAEAGNQLFMHEYGHYMQSQASGPLYMYKYDMPSALTNPNFHDQHWVEMDANSRAYSYFSSNYTGSTKNWNERNFPRGSIRNVKWWGPFVFMIDPIAIIRLNK